MWRYLIVYPLRSGPNVLLTRAFWHLCFWCKCQGWGPACCRGWCSVVMSGAAVIYLQSSCSACAARPGRGSHPLPPRPHPPHLPCSSHRGQKQIPSSMYFYRELKVQVGSFARCELRANAVLYRYLLLISLNTLIQVSIYKIWFYTFIMDFTVMGKKVISL